MIPSPEPEEAGDYNYYSTAFISFHLKTCRHHFQKQLNQTKELH